LIENLTVKNDEKRRILNLLQEKRAIIGIVL